MTKSQAVERTKTETEFPPSDLWIDPEGNGEQNSEADKLSWEKACREGLADKLTGFISAQKPLVEKLRSMIRVGRARMNEILEGPVLREREERLARLEPELLRNEALLKFCAWGIGKGPRALEARLRETEAALQKANGDALQHADARRAVLTAAPDAAAKTAMEKAIEHADRSLAARVDVARKANDEARAAIAENQQWIATAEKRLASLRRNGNVAAAG